MAGFQPPGDIFALGIVMLNWLWWQKQIKKISARQVNGYMTFSALLQGFAAAISMAVYLLLLFAYHFSRLSYAGQNTAREPLGQLAVITLLLPALMAVAWVVFDTKRYLHLSKFPERGGQKGLRMSKFLLCATPVFIVLIVGVWPRAWTYLAGRIYQADQFHHLNFYMMAPALAFAHGKAFAIEIYSQYGIGWPLVVSGLSHFSAMTYANALGLMVVYGCIYYVALFFLLRILFKHEVWACAGVVLAVYWQIFCGHDQGSVIWQVPSSTMIRHPMDVWLFLLLVSRQSSNKKLIAALAGLISALAVLFETETGIYLLIIFVFYSILQAEAPANGGRRFGIRSFWLPLVVYVCTTVVTLPALLFYPSHGMPFTKAFLQGWLQPLTLYGNWGVSALPMIGLGDAPVMFFMLIVMAYLSVIGYAVIKWLRSTASKGEIFFGGCSCLRFIAAAPVCQPITSL